jgi:hypothetical protein
MSAAPFVCPICQRPSWHPRDAEERFCAVVDDVLLVQRLQRKPECEDPPRGEEADG